MPSSGPIGNGGTALVTGGNRGLGLETCRQLAASGHHVLLCARKEEDARSAAAELSATGGRVEPRVLDVADPSSIAALFAALVAEGVKLDALVNNGAVYHDGVTAETVRESVTVNVLGPLRLTDALAPLLFDHARVVMVSSGMGELSGLPAPLRRRFEPPPDRAGLTRLLLELQMEGSAGKLPAGSSLPYRLSKCALNVVTRFLSKELSGRGIHVNAVCPGWVKTRMGGAEAPRDVETGAKGIAWAATLPESGPTGGFFRDGKPIGW